MKPLQGVRVLSVEQFGAAPYGTMFLADMGAEVIKVENAVIGGDPARHTGPFYFGEVDSVCLHISAYGRDNERAAWPGYDYLMQAETGLMPLTGEPDGAPARFGAPSMVDHVTGLTPTVGLLGALLHARQTGQDCDVDTCLFDVALHQLGYAATWYLNEGAVLSRQTRSAHFSLAPVQTFPTADGWLFVMCMTLGGVLPVAPVRTLDQTLDGAEVRAAGMVRHVPHPLRADFRVLANPIKFNGQRLAQRVCAPLGADNAALVSTPIQAETEITS